MDLPKSLDSETRRALMHTLIRVLRWGEDGAYDTEATKASSIELRYWDISNDREESVTEFRASEIYRPNVTVDELLLWIEKAVIRDTQYRYGEATYTMHIHMEGGQMSRERFPFTAPGLMSMRPRSNALATQRRHAFGDDGSGELMGAAEALKVSVEFLKWSTEERKLNDERATLQFEGQQKMLKQYQELVAQLTDREIRVRELANTLDDHAYEREKLRKKEEQREEWMAQGFEMLKVYGPKLLPPILGAIQKFNGGPNYVPPPLPDTVLQTLEEVSAETKSEAPQNQTPELMKQLEEMQQRLAFDTVRFVMLIKGVKKLKLVQETLGDGPESATFDAICKAVEASDVSEPAGIQRVSQLAFTFGGALQAKPEVAMALANALEGFERAALMELAGLLQAFAEALEAMQASSQVGSQSGSQAGSPQVGSQAPATKT